VALLHLLLLGLLLLLLLLLLDFLLLLVVGLLRRWLQTRFAATADAAPAVVHGIAAFCPCG
jgi:hypothetical protein